MKQMVASNVKNAGEIELKGIITAFFREKKGDEKVFYGSSRILGSEIDVYPVMANGSVSRAGVTAGAESLSQMVEIILAHDIGIWTFLWTDETPSA